MRIAALTIAVVVVAAGGVAWLVLRDAPTTVGGRSSPAAAAARAVAGPGHEDVPLADAASSPPSNAAPSREPVPIEREEDGEAGDGEVIRTDASAGREGIVVDGSVVVVDANGHEQPASNGSFRARAQWRGEDGRRIERVSVRDGRLRFRLVAGASCGVDFGVLTLEPDGRLAVPEKAMHDVAEEDPLVIRASVVSPVQLEVVDARSGEPLRGVSVVRLGNRFGGFERRYEPGKGSLDGDPIATNVASPIEVKPSNDRDPDRIEWRPLLFVSAPGHAWAKADVDFRRGGTVRVALEPGADLEVTTIAPEDDRWIWSQLPPRIWIYRPRPGASEPDAERLVDERMRRFAAMDDAELRSATPDGRRPTAAELRQAVTIDLKQLRRAALWGPLVAEVAANVDEPTRVRGLEPGRYVVTLQRDGASRHPQVFAETIVDLAPGTNTLTFAVPEQEEVDKVHLAGTIRISSAWGERHLELRFDPVGVAGATEADERSLSVGDLDLVEGSNDLFRFDVDDLRPGRYLVTSGTHDWQQVVATGARGRDDVRLEIGDPADLLILFVDDETGRAIPVPDAVGVQPTQVVMSGHGVSRGVVLKSGAGPLAFKVFAGAQWDEEGHEVRVRVPAGEVHLAWGSLVADGFEVVDPGRVIAHPGENELTLRLRRSTSIEIAFAGESEAIDFPRELLEVEVKSLDARESTRSKLILGGRRLLIHVPAAGRYLVTLPPIPGCADVPPFEITARAGETVTRTVHLVPER